MNIRPIDTVHNGYKFRSRLEARWAVLFDELGVKYEYEAQGFDLGGEWYLPDFWLPEFECWIEIKPDAPDGDEIRKCQLLARGTGQPVYLFYGSPWYDLDPGEENGILFDSQGMFPAQFFWMRCLECGNLRIGNLEVIPFSDGTSGTVPIGDCFCESFYGAITRDVKDAYEAARQARFERKQDLVQIW